jgi:hypothetical protein
VQRGGRGFGRGFGRGLGGGGSPTREGGGGGWRSGLAQVHASRGLRPVWA